MASNSFKVKNSLVLTPKDLSTLANPEAGDIACDINDNNKIKRYDAASASWVEVGSGGVGGVDILFVQDFESASLSSFTQTGLVLSQTDPLKGKVSAVLNHQTAINQSFKQIIPVDRKFRGIPMILRLDSKSNASQGNVTISIYDETNAASIVASEQLQLSNDTAGKKTSVAFTLPATCASFSYTITALPESGKVTRIDDIICEMAETALLETAVQVPVVTSWASYTPTFQGFGTPTNIEFEWRQVGESVEIRGKFTSGTSTAVEARIGLPAGLTSAGTSLIPSIQEVGVGSYNVVSTLQGIILIEPSVTYLTIGIQATANAGLTKVNGSALLISGNIFSFFASVPCAGLSATTTKAIPLTQSGLIQEADSMIRLSGANGFNGTKRLFSSIIKNIGNDISYIASTGQFIAQKAGIYNISWSEATSVNTTAMSIVLQLNNTDIAYDNQVQNTASTSAKYASVSWQGYLNQGDIITCNVNNTAEFNGLASTFTMSRAGSLKQVSVNPNSKITIPTSELRFEGASAKGTGAEAATVQFQSLAKLRGDAFSVSNSNGTIITILKKGKLSVSASLITTAAASFAITKNQATNSSFSPTVSEIISNATTVTPSFNASVSGEIDVLAGDIIRVSTGGTPNSSLFCNFNLSFQEQDIQVSVSNTLPQFSESDSSVRVDTANGYGSTATKIRRFSNVRENLGSDIAYNPNGDEAINGASFVIKSAGVYNITYSDNLISASTFGLSKNASSLTTNLAALSFSEILSINTCAANSAQSTSWSGYLAAGDIIRPHGDGTATGVNVASFTISKVGKPNVTGVNVTPFVNVPQPISQHSFLDRTQTVGTSTTVTGALSKDTSTGIFSYNPSTGIYTVLKNANFNISAMLQVGVTQVQATILVDGIDVARQFENGAVTGGASCSYSGIINVGSTFYISNSSGAGSSSRQVVSVLATASSDTVLTAPETFSTDTAALTYASSSLYNLTTLANAPVGTYITFTYAANTNTRTQTTTRPTQTDADMNANGMLIYTRAYNAASTAAQPAAIAIQIGKGLKGRSLDLYKSAGKVTAGSLDAGLASPVEYGCLIKEYNEVTGILFVDIGYNVGGGTTSKVVYFSDGTTQTSGYLVINASKNPALTGFGLNRVAAHFQNTSGQTIPSGAATAITGNTVISDTNGAFNASTGVYTIPETGYYNISGIIGFQTAVGVVNTEFGLYLSTSQGAFRIASSNMETIASAARIVSGARTIRFNKGDQVTFQALQTTGSNRNLITDGAFNNFSIAKISV